MENFEVIDIMELDEEGGIFVFNGKRIDVSLVVENGKVTEIDGIIVDDGINDYIVEKVKSFIFNLDF